MRTRTGVGDRDTWRRRALRGVVPVLGGIVLTGVSIAAPPVGASAAAPTADAAVPGNAAPAQPVPPSSADVTFDALFALDAQVYERATVRPAGTVPPSNEVVLRRVHDRSDIDPGAAVFVYVGAALPEAFSFAETSPGSGEGWGVVSPVDPTTLQDLPIEGRPLAVYFYGGPVGPLAGTGIATAYYG